MSRGFGVCGENRKAHPRSADGQRPDKHGGRPSGASCAVACHAESERQARASWTAGEIEKAAEPLFSRQIISLFRNVLGVFHWAG